MVWYDTNLIMVVQVAFGCMCNVHGHWTGAVVWDWDNFTPHIIKYRNMNNISNAIRSVPIASLTISKLLQLQLLLFF